MSTKFGGSFSHFRFDNFYIVDFHSAFTLQVRGGFGQFIFKQARKLQDAKADELTSLQAEKPTS